MEQIVNKKKFFNETGFVLIARSLAKLKGFIIFPIIVKLFGTQTYGIWAQILAIIGFATPMALIGINVAIKRFLSTEKNIDNIAKKFWAIFYFSIITSIFIILILYILSDYLALYLFHMPGISSTLLLAAAIIPLNAINIIFSDVFLAFNKVKKWIFINSLRDIIEIVLILIILYIAIENVIIFLIIITIASLFLTNIIAFILSYKTIPLKKPNFSNIKLHLTVGLPLFLSGLTYTFIHIGDRYIIGYYKDIAQVGIYAGIYTFATVAFLGISEAIFITLLPTLSKFWEKNKIKEASFYTSYLLKYYFILGIPMVFGLTAVSKNLLLVLSNQDFIEFWYIMPIIAFGIFIFQGFGISDYVFILTKKTIIVFYLTLVAVMENIILNIILIPIMGILGAAIASLVTYLTYSVIIFILARKKMKITLHTNSILKSLFASILMYIVLYIFNFTGIIGLILSIIAGIVIYLLVFFILNLNNLKEITNSLNFIKNKLKL